VINPDEEIPNAVDSQLRGIGGWSRKEDQMHLDGLWRAAREAGDLAPIFARAIVRHIADPDVEVRAGAILSVWAVAEHVSADELLSILEARPELFRGVRQPAGYPGCFDDLEGELILAIGLSLTRADQRACRFLQDRALAGEAIGVFALARAIPEWVVANAKAVVRREALRGVLRSLPEAQQRRAVVLALSPWSPEEGRELVESPVWTSLPLAKEELAELSALVLGQTQ
jgi:hypothetical protein